MFFEKVWNSKWQKYTLFQITQHTAELFRLFFAVCLSFSFKYCYVLKMDFHIIYCVADTILIRDISHHQLLMYECQFAIQCWDKKLRFFVELTRLSQSHAHIPCVQLHFRSGSVHMATYSKSARFVIVLVFPFSSIECDACVSLSDRFFFKC